MTSNPLYKLGWLTTNYIRQVNKRETAYVEPAQRRAVKPRPEPRVVKTKDKQ